MNFPWGIYCNEQAKDLNGKLTDPVSQNSQRVIVISLLLF